MRSTTGLAVLAVLVGTTWAAPQYGPQGMGYGYPMNGPMMNGPMMGPYGMNGMGGMNGPMYPPNMPNYHNGRMRGQRCHAHAGADEWPMPANPYMDARSRRHFSNSAFYANGAASNDDDDEVHAHGHNRVPAGENDGSDSDNDDDEGGKDKQSAKSGEGTQVAGVNRVADDSSRRMSELALESNSNTSLDMEALGSKVINIDAFDGASIKPTATAAATDSSNTAATPATASALGRHTVTRVLNAKPTPTNAPKSQAAKARAAVKPQTAKTGVHPATTGTSKPQAPPHIAAPAKDPSNIARASAATAVHKGPESPPAHALNHSAPGVTHPSTHGPVSRVRAPAPQPHTVAMGTMSAAHPEQTHAVSAKHEPSMKNIRGM
ncbi:hypothetical protein IWW50_003699 [Coemansia erecta]|nr:hypothetical protein GGF43_001542 [Coemansia sp. RSA 2618]KAJ2823616.1 hypothetical protein IWW50_003699 [Coemansia erecta]